MKVLSTLIQFLILISTAFAQKLISEIEFIGLEKTERSFADQFIQCKEGEADDFKCGAFAIGLSQYF